MKNIAEAHLLRLLPDAEDRQTLINFLANVVKNPGKKQPFGVVLQGRQGIGKGFLQQWVAELVGLEHSREISTWLRPWSEPPNWLDGCLLAYGDLPDPADLDTVRALVAADKIAVQDGNGKPAEIQARANFLLTTSVYWEVPNDRRFTVLRTSVIHADFPAGHFADLAARGLADFKELIDHV